MSLFDESLAVTAEPYGALGLGAPLADASRPEAVSAPRAFERAPWDGRKDALADAFDGALVGAQLEARAQIPQNKDCNVFLFADAAVACDWKSKFRPVADAAYGVAFQASLLRVDLTKRVGAFAAKPALTLKLADLNSALKCP